MNTKTAKPATAGTVVGWMVLALGIALWGYLIPLTGSALIFADSITIEAGVALLGTVVYGIVGGIGLTAIAYSEHKSERVALWIYLVLLVVALVVAALLSGRA